MMRWWRAAGMGALMTVAACSAPQKIKDAGPAIDAFHHQLDAGAFGAIWQGGDDLLRNATSQAQFVQFVGAVHSKLGNVVKSERTGWNVNYGTNGTIVTVAMNTQFQRGTGTETMTFHAKGDDLKLAGYFINSNDMLVK